MSKQQEEKIVALETQVSQLTVINQELKEALEKRGHAVARRKFEVLELLQDGPKTIGDMAEALETTNKNISSILCQVKELGHEIMTDSKGRKILWDDKNVS